MIGPTEYLFFCKNIIFRESSVYQVADDTCLLVADRNINDARNVLKTNFDLFCKWAHDVGLITNYEKMKFIHNTLSTS